MLIDEFSTHCDEYYPILEHPTPVTTQTTTQDIPYEDYPHLTSPSQYNESMPLTNTPEIIRELLEQERHLQNWNYLIPILKGTMIGLTIASFLCKCKRTTTNYHTARCPLYPIIYYDKTHSF